MTDNTAADYETATHWLISYTGIATHSTFDVGVLFTTELPGRRPGAQGGAQGLLMFRWPPVVHVDANLGRLPCEWQAEVPHPA